MLGTAKDRREMPGPAGADETTSPSDALLVECHTMEQRVKEGRVRADRLRALADHLEAQAVRDERVLCELQAALGLRPQMRLDDLDPRLGGRRLEEVAVELLQQRRDFGEAIHYREWFDLIQRAGYEIAGRDPLATFLAQLNRSESIESVGNRSGRYRLRQGARRGRSSIHA